jgi:hypothetical protein
VASFLFSLRILQLLVVASQAPFYSKLPRLARLYAEKKMTEQLVLASRGMARSHWVYAAGIAAVGLLAQPGLTLIGSHAEFVARPLWFLMGAAFFVERFGAMHIQLYSVTNHIIWHKANGVSGLIYIALSWMLFPVTELYTFPIAILVAYATFYAWYSAQHSYSAFQLQFWTFERRTSLGPAAALSAAAVIALASA